jgi:sec-independent protein translocase protein TatA
VLLVALIVFGPKRIPELGHSLGKGIREFKASLEGHDEGSDSPSPDGAQESPAPLSATGTAKRVSPPDSP